MTRKTIGNNRKTYGLLFYFTKNGKFDRKRQLFIRANYSRDILSPLVPSQRGFRTPGLTILYNEVDNILWLFLLIAQKILEQHSCSKLF